MSVKQSNHKNELIYRAVFVVAIIEPLCALPQLYEIYTSRSAGSVSLLSWILFTFTGIIWLLYGLSIKDKPLTITSAMNVAVELMVIVAILIY